MKQDSLSRFLIVALIKSIKLEDESGKDVMLQ